MHARNRTWLLGSDPVERCRQRTMPVEGGDGSTLSLDFTTGVLDPRLTFTRLSNATFINSSGLVQFAAVNEFRNTGWVTSTTPTGWNVTFGTGTTTWNNDGTLTMNTGGSSTRPCINANSFTVSQGIPYTFGYRVVSASGSPQISNVISSTLVGDTFAINGTPVGGTTVVQAGDVVSCTFTPTTTSSIPRMGPGVNFGMTNTAMTITQPQINPGMTLQAYRANSSTTAANNDSARFDYDPTTIGSPRGLLIEGAATNLAFRSNTLNSTSATEWVNANCLTPAIASGINDPSGGSDTWKVIAATGSAIHSWRNAMGGSTMTSGTAYTISVWARPAEYDRIIISDPGGGTSACTFVMQGSGTATAINNAGIGTCTNPVMVPYKDGWWRCSATFTRVDGSSANRSFGVAGYPSGATTSAFGATYNGDGTSGVYLYGWMMETGSGASSYIPTGASQGSRVAESLTCTGANFSSWYQNATESSVLVESIVDQDATGFRRVFALTSSSNTTTGFPNWSGIVAGASSSRPSINANITANNQVDAYLALAAAVSNGQIFRLAFAAKAGDYRVSRVVSGTTYASTSTYNGYPANIGVAAGSGLYFVSDGAYFRALWLRAFKFYPFRITNAQMDSWAI